MGTKMESGTEVHVYSNGTEVHVYSNGIVYCSACAPAALSAEEVAANVNAQNPTCIRSQWTLSTDEAFSNGLPNGGPCDTHPEERRHWLLSC